MPTSGFIYWIDKSSKTVMVGRAVDFDALAGNYDTLRGRSMERLLPWVVSVVEYADIRCRDKVIDIGCGTGRYTELFTGFCGTVVGIDASPGMIKQASNAKRHAVDYVISDALSIPFRRSSFDCAVMFMAVHLFTAEQRRLLFKGVSEMLRGGGRFVILTESHARIRRSLWRYFPGLLDIDLKRFPDLPTLTLELRAAGFETARRIVRKTFGEFPTKDYLARVEGKMISTFSLMTESEFRDGFEIFSKKLYQLYPVAVPEYQEFVLVRGTKDG